MFVARRAGWLVLAHAGGAATERWRPRLAVAGGVAAGLVLTLVAVAVSGSGRGAAPADGVTVQGSGVQEVQVRLAGMHIHPGIISVAPGVH